MTSAVINENNCLVIDQADFKNFYIHPLWLRERLSEPDFLDSNNYQRLYEPSLLNQRITIKNFSIDNNILTVKFSDEVEGSYSLNSLLAELKQQDIIPQKEPWKNNFSEYKNNYHKRCLVNELYQHYLLMNMATLLKGGLLKNINMLVIQSMRLRFSTRKKLMSLCS